MKYSNVLSPGKIADLTIKNRFVVPALATNFGDKEGHITDQLRDYYIAKAKGGFGLVIFEVVAVDPGGRAIPNQLGLWDDMFINDFKELIQDLHRYGAKVAIQLHHAGRQAISENNGGRQPVAPSPIPCPIRKEMPRELTTKECFHIAEAFADASYRAFLAGADAIELNGAHGYLINQFMSKYSNKRLDEFGGNFERRMRFPLEIIKGIKRQLGSDYPLIFRISADEKVPGGRNLLETLTVARTLEEAGIHALSISAGVYASLEYMSAPGCMSPGYLVDLAENVKKEVNIPIITAGKINYPQLAEEIIAAGKADFVALGRVSVADPEFPNKVAGCAENEIAPCVACLQGCIDSLFDPTINKISCLVNPFVGKEGKWRILPTTQPKKILVAGAGPAGLEFSWIAAKRGHNVICYEKDTTVGGQMRLAGIPSTKDEFLGAIVYFQTMCQKYGVSLKMKMALTQEIIEKEKPNIVVVATGSEPFIPDISGIHQKNVIKASDVLNGYFLMKQKVIVLGGGMVGAETAGFIAERGSEVTIVEQQPDIALDGQNYVRKYLIRRLKDLGVQWITNAKVSEVTKDGVQYETHCASHGVFSSIKKKLEGFDTIVLATGALPYNELARNVNQKNCKVITIGDACKVGKAMQAIAQAAEQALLV